MATLQEQRHSLAHLLAMVVRAYDKEAKLAIGPVIENGFYYDFEFSTNKRPTDKDLKDFRKAMIKLANKKLNFVQKEISESEARDLFKDQPYKLELIEELVKAGEKLTVYESGDFTDLCAGPHVKNTSEISADAFELTTVAGAYWRGDEKNKMLTRIYGIAFETAEELETYKKQAEEAVKRDHRKIGKEQDLFTLSELVGSGLPLFTPKGAAMRRAVIEKIYDLQKAYGYEEVWIPHITKPELYKMSGHWEKFGDELFKLKGRDSEFVMKPMNCPHHTQIYASRSRSYRELPVRFIEATTCYRDEQSGELLGLSRVRALTQDDGHVFCRPDQIKDEIKNIISVIEKFYTSLGMWEKGKFRVALSIRDPKTPEKYLGGDEVWSKAENALKEIAEEEKLPYAVAEGDAAFYGPKLDFMFKDAIGREWQLGTVQLDFNMPARFSLEYTDSDGVKKTPVMIHRAIAGSLERFLSVIIEHFAGSFPFWLSPVQVKVLPIGEAHEQFAKEVYDALRAKSIRTELDASDDGLGKKVRKAKVEKVPYWLVIGDKEVASSKVTVESRDRGQLNPQTISEFLDMINQEL